MVAKKEGPESSAKSSESESLPLTDPKEIKKLDSAATHHKDYGDWKYKPWDGIDHWVNEKTGGSTFDLKSIR